ncbi:hypothetical protein PIB30_026478 [Stylosanthes scabra]|uniref:DUF382 domain-containing protein n=1 Tax=Stylosanthes scabra TaxID=79078 RepID=A0ABU6X977_9FABA|nr:hypothetical protein [Stylosanthes scabra]
MAIHNFIRRHSEIYTDFKQHEDKSILDVEDDGHVSENSYQAISVRSSTEINRVRDSIRDQIAYIEKEDNKKLKQKQRERMPKMGKMDIDYQLLHDAFFKYQTKPKLASLGDLYHEEK